MIVRLTLEVKCDGCGKVEHSAIENPDELVKPDLALPPAWKRRYGTGGQSRLHVCKECLENGVSIGSAAP